MPHFFCPELCEQNRKSSLRVLSLRTFLGFPPLPISPYHPWLSHLWREVGGWVFSHRWSLRCPHSPRSGGTCPRRGLSKNLLSLIVCVGSLLVVWPPPASCCEEKAGFRRGWLWAFLPCPLLFSHHSIGISCVSHFLGPGGQWFFHCGTHKSL